MSATKTASEEEAKAAAIDTITILRCKPNLCIAKRISPGGKIKDYDNACRFSMKEYRLNGLDSLEKLLRHISTNPRMCVVLLSRLVWRLWCQENVGDMR